MQICAACDCSSRTHCRHLSKQPRCHLHPCKHGLRMPGLRDFSRLEEPCVNSQGLLPPRTSCQIQTGPSKSLLDALHGCMNGACWPLQHPQSTCSLPHLRCICCFMQYTCLAPLLALAVHSRVDAAAGLRLAAARRGLQCAEDFPCGETSTIVVQNDRVEESGTGWIFQA